MSGLTVVRPGKAAPFAEFDDSGAVDEDSRAGILTELVAEGRFDAAVEFHAAMRRDRPESATMRWALARAFLARELDGE